MEPVLRGFNGRRSSLPEEAAAFHSWSVSLSPHTLYILLSLSLSTSYFSLRPWIFMSQQSELAVFSPAEINGGVRSERPRGWIQTLGRISYCQRGAYLFLSSRSSVRQVSDPQSVAVSVSRRPLLIAFLFQVNIAHSCGFGQKKIN